MVVKRAGAAVFRLDAWVGSWSSRVGVGVGKHDEWNDSCRRVGGVTVCADIFATDGDDSQRRECSMGETTAAEADDNNR